MGILLAFAMVCIGVLVLRRKRPDMDRPFRVPLAPLTCILGALFCGGMAYFLPSDTWWRLAIWTALGLLIYGLYGYRNSRLRKQHT